MDDQNSHVAAVVLGSLFAGDGARPVGEADFSRAKIASQWQLLAQYAELAEMRGMLAGMKPGYMAEVFGRAAAAGEQLGLALTATRDAEAWQALTPDPKERNRRAMAGRALAEASAL